MRKLYLKTLKARLLLLSIVILSLSSYAQIEFENGYYINNSNQKIDCQIKNVEWRNNPTEFEFRLSENEESQKATIKQAKEFGINNISKYVRKTINIDRSSDDVNNLSNTKSPTFEEEELYLKVLIEGEKSLYEYINGNLKRYFFDKGNSKIEQLIYKRYLTFNNNTAINSTFRQQLWSNFKCPTFKMDKIENVKYNKSSLIKFFEAYGKCNNSQQIYFNKKQKKDLFNLTLRPRLNSNSLSIKNSEAKRNYDLENKTSFGFGVELEYILPFNKNKWSIFVEPTYQYYNSEELFDADYVSGGKLKVKVDYSSIEIPIGLRHYFHINNSGKIFLNISTILGINSSSSIEFLRNDGSRLNSFEISTPINFAFGAGYKHNEKYSIELRFPTNRNLLNDYNYWSSDYKALSVILGYSLF